jgi:hypothetical protein
MSSDYAKLLIATDVWAILDNAHTEAEMFVEEKGGVADLLMLGYRLAIREFSSKLHELPEFQVMKINLKGPDEL